MLVVLYICALWTLVHSAHLLAKRDDCYRYDGTKGWCSTPLYGCGYDEVGSGPDCPCRCSLRALTLDFCDLQTDDFQPSELRWDFMQNAASEFNAPIPKQMNYSMGFVAMVTVAKAAPKPLQT